MAAWRKDGKRIVKATGVPESSGKTAAIMEAIKLKETSAGSPAITYGEYVQNFYAPGSPYLTSRAAKGKALGASWAKKVSRLLENHTTPKWGKTPLDRLKAIEIENWLLSLNLKNQTRNHILYAAFRVPLREARRQGLITSAFDTEPFSASVDKRVRDVFTRKELLKLFPQNLLSVWGSEKWAVIFLVLTTTGIRKGELRALRWTDFQGEFLNIVRAVKNDNSIGAPKARKAGEGRPVPLIAVVVAALNGWKKLSKFTGPEDLIFPLDYDHKKPLANAYFGMKLKKACKAAGIEIANRSICVHSLRHSFITLLKGSEAQNAVMALAGHKDPRVTEGYSHPSLEDQKKLLEPSRPVIEQVFDFLVKS